MQRNKILTNGGHIEKKGVNEYLFVYWGTVANYWTSTNKKGIHLEIHNIDMTDPKKGYSYEVNFPNSKIKYLLHQDFKNNKLVCKHPDGRIQVFRELPKVYVSKGFEQKGVAEYLEHTDKGEYWYYIGKNKHRKVRLIPVDVSENNRIAYRFPGSNAIYLLGIQAICLGGVVVSHPNKRVQVFDRYDWKD